VLGLISFGFSLYDEEVKNHRDFDLLFDFLQSQQTALRQSMCQESTRHWLQASKIYAWSVAVRSDLYFQSGLVQSEPRLPMDSWGLEKGSRWECSASRHCLVPAGLGEVVDQAYPKHGGGSCSANSYLRICGQNITEAATWMVPQSCFSASFSASSTTSPKRRWTLTFQRRERLNGFDDIDADMCDKPLQEYATGHASLMRARANMEKTCKER